MHRSGRKIQSAKTTTPKTASVPLAIHAQVAPSTGTSAWPITTSAAKKASGRTMPSRFSRAIARSSSCSERSVIAAFAPSPPYSMQRIAGPSEQFAIDHIAER